MFPGVVTENQGEINTHTILFTLFCSILFLVGQMSSRGFWESGQRSFWHSAKPLPMDAFLCCYGDLEMSAKLTPPQETHLTPSKDQRDRAIMSAAVI